MNQLGEAGQLIARRYQLVEPTPNQLGIESARLWYATDTLLSKRVRLIMLDPAAPTTADALDAARRTALLDNAHTVRVRSVADSTDSSLFPFICTEIPIGAQLSSFLTGAQVPADQVHALAGEVASILADARDQGIRHLHLTSDSVWIDSSGEVYVDGLGIMAALAGRNTAELSSEEDRLEAKGVVALAAAMLIGHPHPSEQQIASAVEAGTSDLELPERLRTAFIREFNGQGALSTSDLVRELVPWGRIDQPRLSMHSWAGHRVNDDSVPVQEAAANLSGSNTEEFNAELRGEASNGTPVKHTDANRVAATESSPLSPKWPSVSPESLDPAGRASLLQAAAGVAGAAGAAGAAGLGTDAAGAAGLAGSAGASACGADTPRSPAHASPEVFEADQASSATSNDSENHTFGESSTDQDLAEAPVQESMAPNEPATTVIQTPYAPPTSQVPDSSVNLEAGSPIAPATSDTRVEVPPMAATVAMGPTQAEPTPPVGTAHNQGLSMKPQFPSPERTQPQQGAAQIPPRAPAPQSDDSGKRRYNPSKVFVAGAIILVALSGAWAVHTLTDPPQVPSSSSTASAVPSESASSSASESPSAPATTTAALPAPTISSVTLLNPQAAELDPSTVDTQDSPSTVVNAYDGDASTSWRSWWYSNPSFVGKEGIGLEIQLTEEAQVNEVILQVNGSGGNVQWLDTTAAAPSTGTVLAEGSMSSSTSLKPSESQATSTIILWFNSLPTDPDGQYRIDLAEITVQ